jgi:dihydrofolate reductase
MPAKLILKMHQSIDGFVCTPSGDESWVFMHMDESVLKWEVDHLWQAGTHIMGSNLYRIMAAYWPDSHEAPAALMNEIPKVVFSKTLKTASWGPARIASGDLVTEIARLKQESSKEILAHGGAAFAQSLTMLNLIDEYRLLVHPLALGNGRPLTRSPLNLRLLSAHEFPAGVVALTYARV